MQGLELLQNCQPFTLVDAGSRNGLSAVPLLHPYSHYFGFDPIPDGSSASQKYLREKIIPSCLAAKAGIYDFFCYSHPSMSSLLEFDEKAFLQHFGLMENSAQWRKQFNLQERKEVEGISLFDAFTNENLHQIDFLKLDTQGTELEILKGGESLLAAKKINLIACEIAFIPVYKKQALFQDIANYLNQFGYRLIDLSVYPEAQAQWGKAAASTYGFKERIRYASGGDALFYCEPGEDKSAQQRMGLILAAAGIYSLAKYHLHLSGLPEKQIELVFRQFQKIQPMNKSMSWKNFLKISLKRLFG